MTKRALVTGIDNYTTWNSGVQVGQMIVSAPNLNCCIADADSFGQVLTDGFIFDEVTVLKDAQATSQAILGGLKGLLDKSAAGDVVCFYFSGHGGRMPETPSASSTRYYETIIPYDATMITSMDIAALADALMPSEINFTLVLDSCNSGGMFLSPDARGFIWDEATAKAFESSCETIVPWICLLDTLVLDGNVSNLALQASGVCSMIVDASRDNPDKAKATLLSACDYGELSGEQASLGHGFFTQAILDVVNQCNFTIAHPDLLTSLRTRVSELAGAGQTPQLRGRPVRLEEAFLAGWTYSI